MSSTVGLYHQLLNGNKENTIEFVFLQVFWTPLIPSGTAGTEFFVSETLFISELPFLRRALLPMYVGQFQLTSPLSLSVCVSVCVCLADEILGFPTGFQTHLMLVICPPNPPILNPVLCLKSEKNKNSTKYFN